MTTDHEPRPHPGYLSQKRPLRDFELARGRAFRRALVRLHRFQVRREAEELRPPELGGEG